MIEDDGGFMRRETECDSSGYDPDEPCCVECGSTEDNCPCDVFIPDITVGSDDIDLGCAEDAYWMGRD